MDLGGTATEVRIDFRKNFSPVIPSDLEEAFYPDRCFGGGLRLRQAATRFSIKTHPKKLFPIGARILRIPG